MDDCVIKHIRDVIQRGKNDNDYRYFRAYQAHPKQPVPNSRPFYSPNDKKEQISEHDPKYVHANTSPLRFAQHSFHPTLNYFVLVFNFFETVHFIPQP